MYPFLIYNVDEISSYSSRKYIVLKTNYIKKPICPDSKYSSRVSIVLCINSLSLKIVPFEFVLSLKNMPIAFQNNRWMTIHLWSAFCVYFTQTIQKIRNDLNNEDSKKYALRIVDKHSSHLNSYAKEYLLMNKIHLVRVPSHCTHLIQTNWCISCIKLQWFKITAQFSNKWWFFSTNCEKLMHTFIFYLKSLRDDLRRND